MKFKKRVEQASTQELKQMAREQLKLAQMLAMPKYARRRDQVYSELVTRARGQEYWDNAVSEVLKK